MSRRRRLARLRFAAVPAALAAGLAVPAIPRAAGSEIYVAAPSGQGTGCTEAAPCALATALQVAGSAGGTVQLTAGSYIERTTLGLAASTDVSIVGSPLGSTLVGTPAGPLLSITGTASVTLSALTLRGSPGGALSATGGPLLVEDSTFADDGTLASAIPGGAIDFTPAVPGATLALSGTTFSDDVSGVLAGAVAVNAGTAAIEGSTFVNDGVGSGPGTSTGTSAGAVGGAGVVTLQADIFASDGAVACAPGTLAGIGVVVAGGICGAASRVALGSLFPTGLPVLATNGGPVPTIEIAPIGDPAVGAVPTTAPSLALGASAFCSLSDARGLPRLSSGASACAAGALAPDPPVVSAISPAGGRPGTSVRLSGTGLSLVTGGTLDGTPVTRQASGDTSLVIVIPTGIADGSDPLFLTSPDGATTVMVRVNGPFVVNTTSFPLTEVGENVVVGLVASGGVGANRWSTSGLPDGLRLSAGAVVGQPTSPFSGLVTFTVTDRLGHRASATVLVAVNPAPTVTIAVVPTAEVGQHYAVQFHAEGGTPPYRFAVAPGGAIPGGLSLNSGGVLAGEPALAGTTAFTLAVVDALGGVGTQRYTLVVSARPPAPERYAVVGRLGRVLSFGSTNAATQLPRPLAPYVAAAADPRGAGYWVLASGGRVLGIDGAHSEGSVGSRVHPARLVGIAADPAGPGYWVASATGQVYGFGTAHALAPDVADRPLAPVVAIAAAPRGNGYWLLETTGRVDAYGTARPLGSLPPGDHLHAAAIAPTLGGTGYTVLTKGGRLEEFGAARLGNRPSHYAAGSYVAIATAPVGIGEWVVSRDGLVRAFGSAHLLPGPPERLGSAAVALVGGS